MPSLGGVFLLIYLAILLCSNQFENMLHMQMYLMLQKLQYQVLDSLGNSY